MRVKLRPGCHFAPTRQGLLCRFHDSSFVVRGPAALFGLLDSRIGALMDGTDTTELTASVGPAAPVLERILETLVERGYVFDLDAAGGPAPDPETAVRYEDLLSHLEEHCAQPYAALATVRSSRVRVLGDGPAAVALRRTLESYGATITAERSADLTILIDDEQEPLDLPAVAPRESAAILPLLADAERIVLGPVLDGARRLPAFLAAADRVARWQRAEPTAPAPHRVGAALAGSSAARRALDHLAGIGGDEDLIVVHGHDASTTRVPFTAHGTSPTWLPLNPEHLDTGTRDDEAVTAAGTEGGSTAMTDSVTRSSVTAEDRLAALTARWRGLGRWLGASGAVGRPVVAVGLEAVVAAPDGPEVGWGNDVDAARRSAVLALLRTHIETVGGEDSGGAGDRMVAAAGGSVGRWVLDGVLRLLARDALGRPPDRAVRWEELDSSTSRSLWSAVDDYHGSPVDLREQRIPGFDWSLVSARDRRTGALVTAEWGPSVQTAAYAALGTMFAHYEQRAEKARWSTVGTHCVELLSESAVSAAIRQLTGDVGLSGRSVGGLRLIADPVIGGSSIPAGWVWLT